MDNPTAPDGGEKLAAEWAGKLPRDQFEMLLLLTNKSHARGRNAALEEAAKAIENHSQFARNTRFADLIRTQQKGPSNG